MGISKEYYEINTTFFILYGDPYRDPPIITQCIQVVYNQDQIDFRISDPTLKPQPNKE